MSDLQLSLLVIGVVVVAAVYMYNWWQERRLRRRLQEAFGEERDDALMKAQSVAAPRMEPQGRMEPQLQPAYGGDADGDAQPAATPVAQPARPLVAEPASVPVSDVPWFDEALDYIAEIRAPSPIGAAVVAELLAKAGASGKPCRAAGYSEEGAEWEDLARTGAGRHARARFAVQLVDRSGAISAGQLAAYAEAVRASAGKIGAAETCPDVQEALRRARALDELCAEVDVAIGINVIAPRGVSFGGADIRSHAEAAGFKLEPDGVFHYRGDDQQTLFALDNHEPLPFIPEQMHSLTTAGVTLLLDVPRVADGKRALEIMVDTAQRLADGLGGRVVDDNRVALNAAGIASIRQQLDGIASAMAAQGIAPGGERALRLFS